MTFWSHAKTERKQGVAERVETEKGVGVGLKARMESVRR